MANAPIILNLTDSDVKGFEVAPAGTYKVEIAEAELTESKSDKNKGKPMWKLELQSLEETYKGKFFVYAPLWQGAHFTYVALGKALGFINDAGDNTVPDVDTLIGKELAVKVTVEKYTNKDGEEAERNQVKSYAPANGGGAKKAGAKSSKFTL